MLIINNIKAKNKRKKIDKLGWYKKTGGRIFLRLGSSCGERGVFLTDGVF